MPKANCDSFDGSIEEVKSLNVPSFFPKSSPIDETELPYWSDLPGFLQESLQRANLDPALFNHELGRRRGDVLNFWAALSAHNLWERIFIENPRQEMGFNGISFQPQPNSAALQEQLKANPSFSDLTQTWRGTINRFFHPEKYNFSENVPFRAPLHFTFNDSGPAGVHFDYFNAHATSVWPLLGHALVEYPCKFWWEFSNAKDIQECLNLRFQRNVWKF